MVGCHRSARCGGYHARYGAARGVKTPGTSSPPPGGACPPQPLPVARYAWIPRRRATAAVGVGAGREAALKKVAKVVHERAGTGKAERAARRERREGGGHGAVSTLREVWWS